MASKAGLKASRKVDEPKSAVGTHATSRKPKKSHFDENDDQVQPFLEENDDGFVADGFQSDETLTDVPPTPDATQEATPPNTTSNDVAEADTETIVGSAPTYVDPIKSQPDNIHVISKASTLKSTNLYAVQNDSPIHPKSLDTHQAGSSSFLSLPFNGVDPVDPMIPLSMPNPYMAQMSAMHTQIAHMSALLEQFKKGTPETNAMATPFAQAPSVPLMSALTPALTSPRPSTMKTTKQGSLLKSSTQSGSSWDMTQDLDVAALSDNDSRVVVTVFRNMGNPVIPSSNDYMNIKKLAAVLPAHQYALIFKMEKHDASQVVLGVMVGGVSECHLHEPTDTGTNAVKCITITPTEITMASFRHTIRRKGAQTSYSPKKKTSKYYGSDAKEGAPEAARGQGGKPWMTMINQTPALEFEAEVPIFDATEHGFAFDDAAFAGLTKLPQQFGDASDNTIVAVGYTVNLWSLNTTMLPAISLNVQFVILLVPPPLDDDNCAASPKNDD
ncbi:hypothetical protein BJ165DRAFT_1409497 [Panaeolus papilionaceus]|nr:hypothetical protein BJ165DRAFT_1409497 [Panaeolus papilionaceus]